MQLHSGRP